MRRTRQIAIVGAGIGGLALAGSLGVCGSEQNELTIFERRTEIKGLGAGLTLWPNATRVLKDLGVLETCLAKSGPLRTLTVQLAGGKVVMKIPIESFSTPAIAMHRADLHEALRVASKAAATRLNSTCLGVREDETGAFLKFEDREHGPFDVVIAADGIRSALREYVQGDQPLRDKGYTIWRGVAVAPDLIEARGEFFETWGQGQRFGILPMGQGQVCWYASCNTHQIRGASFRVLIDQKAFLQEAFKGWIAPVEQLIERTPLASLIPAEAQDLKPIRPWSRGRVVLLGDAVHPLVANLGLGGNMAIEDSWVLARLLCSEKSVIEAFRIYEKLRFSRVASVVRRSSFIGQVGQVGHPVFSPIRDWVCSRIPGSLFTTTSRSLHSYQANSVVEI